MRKIIEDKELIETTVKQLGGSVLKETIIVLGDEFYSVVMFDNDGEIEMKLFDQYRPSQPSRSFKVADKDFRTQVRKFREEKASRMMERAFQLVGDTRDYVFWKSPKPKPANTEKSKPWYKRLLGL